MHDYRGRYCHRICGSSCSYLIDLEERSASPFGSQYMAFLSKSSLQVDAPPPEVSFLAAFGEEKGTDNDVPTAGDVSRPYSVFTTGQKRLTVFLVTFAALFSPLSSFIFFPAVDALSKSLHVSVEKINLTITSYMIVAGIAPAIMGDLADMTGRRIVYLLTLSIYCAANVGLALQHSWTALFILRMLQSAGGAGMFTRYPPSPCNISELCYSDNRDRIWDCK